MTTSDSLAGGDDECLRLAERLHAALEDRLVAVYLFGSQFGRGPRASSARMLTLIDRVDRAALDLMAPLAHDARARSINLRVDTADALLASADAFPVLTLELLRTRRLIHGVDALERLSVDAVTLRLRIEQNLRAMHRDLVQAYLDGGDRLQPLAAALRSCARKLVVLLEGTLIAAALDVPQPSTPERVVAALAPLVGAEDVALWQRLCSFASYDNPIERDELGEFFGVVLDALDRLIAVVDAL